MNFRMNKVHDLYTLKGSFAMPVGDVEKTENGVTLGVNWIHRRTGNSTVLKKA